MLKYEVNPEWYRNSYMDSTPVIPAARSFSMLHEAQSSRAVLVIHGYAGYPGELVHPAIQLYEEGFDVFVPRLPGMGTSGADFMKSRSSDWLTVCRNAAGELTKRYDRVDVVCHSMGTLIGIILAHEFTVSHLVLAMPAFSMPAIKKWQIDLVSIFKKDIRTTWQSDSRYHLHYENAPADDAALGSEYWSHIYPGCIKELLKLQKMALQLFPSLTCDTLIISGGKDAVTDPSVCTAIAREKKGGVTEYLNIDDATHYVFYDISPACEAAAVAAVTGFLKD